MLGRKRVYVDAKILNVHDPRLPRRAFVGYVVEETGEESVSTSKATESDDAEVDAILYAIGKLKGKHGRITVVCDHESVVSEALSEDPGKQGEAMTKLRETLKENKWVKLEVLKANPAHGVVTAFVNDVLEKESAGSR